MGEFQHIFQHYISEIRTLLILAQSAGRIEKYQLEVIFPSKAATSWKNPHDENIREALLNVLQTVQKMITELSCPELEELYPAEMHPIPAVKSLYGDGDPSCGMPPQVHPMDVCPRSQRRLECISHVGQVDHCQNPGGDCLSPQQPTTKETEAANVLMNLSGKAADRVSQGRIEPCVRPKVLPSFDGKSTVCLVPAGSASSRLEPEVKRDHIVCDEVPQINEKDLLPLATQVLCQFCSRQCEDLVELHEHVLAMHNVPDSELPLMPSVKRLKMSCEEEKEEEEVTLSYLTYSEIQKESLSHSCLNPVKSVMPPKLFSDDQGLPSKQESSKKPSAEEKVVVKRGKCKSAPFSMNYEDSQEHLNGLMHHHLERKNLNRDVSHQVVKTIHVTVPPRDAVARNPEPAPLVSEQQQFQTVTIGNERENQNLSKPGVKSASGYSHADVTERVPAVSDALAIAVESSQIKIIEAKVTIFVCLKCSWSYTHSQEYKNHVCSADRPFVKTCADGSVVLVDNPSICKEDQQLSSCNVWYFPEFLIRQSADCVKQGFQNLEIIHCTSGRTLQLYTSYQPSYLGEQFISFRCSTCEKDSDSLNRFLEHLTAGPCMFRCPECSLVYKTQDKLQNHRASMHPDIEDRTCPNCHTVFEKRHQRNKHLKTKCSKNHMCSVCSKVLKNEYNLRVHMQSHKEREHICKECGASFYRRTILLRHMMRHSGTRPHTCTLCSAKFFTRQHLNTHLDRHNGLKRYPCSACCKAYYSKHDRDNHFLKIHNRASACQKLSKVKDEDFNDEPSVE